jgi:hypothetical protein
MCKRPEMNMNRATENAVNVLLAVEENKNVLVSLRQIRRNFEIYFTTTQQILKDQRPLFHSLKYTRHQEEDKEKRIEFCEVMMENVNNDRTFVSRILFSDQCTYSLHGEPNTQNYRYWSTDNQHLVLQTHSQYRNNVIVWRGLYKFPGHHDRPTWHQATCTPTCMLLVGKLEDLNCGMSKNKLLSVGSIGILFVCFRRFVSTCNLNLLLLHKFKH